MDISSDKHLLCWPRMTPYEASIRWESLRAESLHTIANGIDVATVQGEYYPLARKRAGAEDLISLRARILQIASSFGYPSLVRGRRLVEFDQALGAVVHEQMRIMPADAAHADVWTFVNTVVAPDIVLWRYGKFDETKKRWLISEERIFDLTRTTIGRLWWRVHLLGPEIARSLGEDEAVQLLEKPRIGGFRDLSRCIGERHLHFAAIGATTRRMELLRDVTKRLIRKMAVQSVYVMSPSQLAGFVDELFLESAAGLGIELVVTPTSPDLAFSGSRMRSEMDWPI